LPVLVALAAASLGCSGLLGLDEFTGGADGGVAGAGGTSTGTGGTGGGTSTGTGGTGGTGGTAGMGGGVATGGADVTFGSWDSPAEVTSLNAHCNDADDPSFTADGLLLYFNCDSDGDPDIWVSERTNTDDPWGSPALVDELSSGVPETNVAVSSDGLEIWFARNISGDLDIFTAKRISRADAWGSIAEITALTTSGNEYPCAVTSDLQTMVYGRGGSTQDLYVTKRVSTVFSWDEGALIAEVDSLQSNQEAWLSPDGLHLYFTSERPGGQGNSDIYRSQRAKADEPFSSPVEIGDGINGSTVDTDPWLLPDRSYIMFVRGETNRRIYEASRPVYPN
jgi:hypothetical protein